MLASLKGEIHVVFDGDPAVGLYGETTEKGIRK